MAFDIGLDELFDGRRLLDRIALLERVIVVRDLAEIRLGLLGRLVKRQHIHPAEFGEALSSIYPVRADVGAPPGRVHTYPEPFKIRVPVDALVLAAAAHIREGPDRILAKLDGGHNARLRRKRVTRE